MLIDVDVVLAVRRLYIKGASMKIDVLRKREKTKTNLM